MRARVADTLEALRAASAELVALSQGERTERVGSLLDAWSRRDSPWQKALVEALPAATGFSPEMIAEAAAAGFAPLDGAALRRLAPATAPPAGAPPSVVGAVLAGAIPMPTLLSAALPLCAGRGVALKPSAGDPVSPRLVVESAAALDPLLGRCLAVVTLDADPDGLDALLRADLVELTGSDESVRQLAGRAGPGATVIEHGHRFSAAVIGGPATHGDALGATAAALARDVARWDQLGCLSPVGVWVVDPQPHVWDDVSEALAGALAEAERRWPRGELDIGARSALRHGLETDAMREAAGAGVRVLEGDAWCVVREAEPSRRPGPLYRTLRVYPARDVDDVCGALRVDAAQLAALAVSGLGDDERSALATLHPSRVCEPGALQTPPLSWPRDHLDPLGVFAGGPERSLLR